MKKKLKIVLKKDIENLGAFGEIKEVTAGYARNYLVPKGLGLYLKDPQSKQILKQAEENKKKREKEIEKLKEITQKLEGSLLIIKAKVGEKGKLFGSIGAKEVVEKLAKDAKIKLDKKQIEMEPAKEIGEREVLVKLGYNIESRFKVKVEPIRRENARRKSTTTTRNFSKT